VSASQTKVNGTQRPVPVVDGWRPFPLAAGNGTVWERPAPTPEAPTPEPTAGPPAEPKLDLVAAAEAAAIRQRAEAEAEALRVEAEGKARAAEILAVEEAKAKALANERDAVRLKRDKQRAERDDLEHAIKTEDLKKRLDETRRASAEADRQAEAAAQEEADKQAEIAKADKKWRKYAICFAVMCGIVALPVQISAFWNPAAWWMVAAPVMLEGGAWVVHRGAAAAVANGRPAWHFRTVMWVQAFVAAGINLYHGLAHFDPGTAIGTALASVAGPGVWDLHENGRIRKRDGKLTWRQRRAERKAEKKAAAEKLAEERTAAEREAYLEKAAREAAERLAKERAEKFPEIWKHALKLAAALGETAVTESVWRRAHKDVEGTDPGDSAEVQQLRNAAARRMLDARSDAPDKSVWKISSSQVDQQVPRANKRGHAGGPPVRGVRRPNDTPKFAPGARKQAAIAAKQSANATTD
jgi:hypothetical protein